MKICKLKFLKFIIFEFRRIYQLNFNQKKHNKSMSYVAREAVTMLKMNIREINTCVGDLKQIVNIKNVNTGSMRQKNTNEKNTTSQDLMYKNRQQRHRSTHLDPDNNKSDVL